ncbi:MAG: ribonuclease Y [Deinococcus sp.]|nr:ribonuclease Y [Deinococcus sp.]
MNFLLYPLLTLAALAAGYGLRVWQASRGRARAEHQAREIQARAEEEAKATLKEAEARAAQELEKAERHLKELAAQQQRNWEEAQKRLHRREEQLDRRSEKIESIEERILARETELERLKEQSKATLETAERKLQEISNLTPEQAKELVLGRLDRELEHEKALRIKTMDERVHGEAKRRASAILAQAIQRSASEVSSTLSASVVHIPSDAMKGRIIGREGRNVRAFEALTGVDLIIDDTPEAVVLSSFDPVRREKAKLALERLVQDGRIHPARIEEVLEKADEEIRQLIQQKGEEAAIDAGVIGLRTGVLQLLGTLYFRTSYGQSILNHCLQVAHLSGVMAAELGLDVAMAKRAGLLHDIGKSIDRNVDGTHPEIGANLAKRFNEPPEVLDAIRYHHETEKAKFLYATLVEAADEVSIARPGARREQLETYVKRLEQLEALVNTFPGVEKTFAIQAGREVRVIVAPEKISDAKAVILARDVAKRIEHDMEYPGQVQVTVVRESRAVQYAK